MDSNIKHYIIHNVTINRLTSQVVKCIWEWHWLLTKNNFLKLLSVILLSHRNNYIVLFVYSQAQWCDHVWRTRWGGRYLVRGQRKWRGGWGGRLLTHQVRQLPSLWRKCRISLYTMKTIHSILSVFQCLQESIRGRSVQPPITSLVHKF